VKRGCPFLVALAPATSLLVWVVAAHAQTAEKAVSISVRVDPRVELISIIFRLAGNPEYNQGRVPSYNAAIDQWFGLHRNHPVVQFAATLRDTCGVSYDAPMSLAVCLTDVPRLDVRVPLDPWPEGLDRRWRTEDVSAFLEKARDFAAETRFRDFVASQQALYDTTARRAETLFLREGRLEWFDHFFGGDSRSTFCLALAMANGGCCYGAHVAVNGITERHCILGVTDCDEGGLPSFDPAMVETIVHEFCHSYANPIVEAHAAELEAAGTRIFAQVEEQMKRMAYGNWRTMMIESVVRGAVVRYLEATQGAQTAQAQIKTEQEHGFVWLGALSELLAEYETHRDEYATFDRFFPKIAAFFNTRSENIAAECEWSAAFQEGF